MIDLVSLIQPAIGALAAVGTLVAGWFLAKRQGRQERDAEIDRDRLREAKRAQSIEDAVRRDPGAARDSLRDRINHD